LANVDEGKVPSFAPPCGRANNKFVDDSEICEALRYGAGGWYAPPGVDLAAFRAQGWL
jgi:hypothetical protein